MPCGWPRKVTSGPSRVTLPSPTFASAMAVPPVRYCEPQAHPLATLSEPENQPTAASVRQLMFIFDDVVTLEKESIKALIGRVDRKILTTALKGTSEKIKSHFTQCMSQRSAEMLTEDMEALGPVRIRDVSAAQQQIITTIRQMEKEGVIASSGGGKGDDDGYVV